MLHSQPGKWCRLFRSILPRDEISTAVALVSGTLLMTELALTRIFSVVMYYHFAFLAISIALFGLSASGVFAYVARRWLDRLPAPTAARAESAAIYAVCTIVALFVLVRLRVGLNYSPRNLELMLDHLRAGGAAVFCGRPRHHARDLAVFVAHQRGLRRRSDRRRRGLPGAHPAARPARGARRRADRRRAGGDRRRVLFAPAAQPRALRRRGRRRDGRAARRTAIRRGRLRRDRYQGARKATASSSASGTRSRASACTSARTATGRSAPAYTGPLPDTRFMDIDSAASTPILHARAGPRRTSSTSATS